MSMSKKIPASPGIMCFIFSPQLQVLRILMFLLAWPFLRWTGSVVSFKEAVVLCWSGLRGAVGLSLALFILLDDAISDEKFRTLTFFYMGCVTFLTIVLQGASMGPLLQVPPLCSLELSQASVPSCRNRKWRDCFA